MNWVCELTEDAEQDLRKLPKPIQKRVARVLTQLGSDPFQGDVKALHGEDWKGCSGGASATTDSSLPRIMKRGSFPCCAFSCGLARPTVEAALTCDNYAVPENSACGLRQMRLMRHESEYPQARPRRPKMRNLSTSGLIQHKMIKHCPEFLNV